MQPHLSHFLITSCTGIVLVNAVGDLAERCRWLRPRQAWLAILGGWGISFARCSGPLAKDRRSTGPVKKENAQRAGETGPVGTLDFKSPTQCKGCALRKSACSAAMDWSEQIASDAIRVRVLLSRSAKNRICFS